MKTALGATSATGLLASILIANYVTTRYGFIPVGFGVTATAGTFAAGFALALRDATQDLLGRKPMFAVLALGAILSYFISDPYIALASAIAFAASELLDYAVYTPLRKKAKLGGRRWAGAVAASGTVGAVTDTLLFLGIAFGYSAIAPALLGQLIGKTYATIAYLLIGKGAAHVSAARTRLA